MKNQGGKIKKKIFKINQDLQYLQVNISGPMVIEEIIVIIGQAYAKALENNLNKILVNAVTLNPIVKTMQIHDLPGLHLTLGRERLKVGLVYDPDSNKTRDFRFYETVMRNNGLTVKLFTDLFSAEQWLI